MTASHILFLTQSEALSSILASTLECKYFKTHQANCTQDAIAKLRLHPIDHIVCDFSIDDQTVAQFIPNLRCAAPYRPFQVMALTANVDCSVQKICRVAGVDEVVVKPMSPRFIAERLATKTPLRLTPFTMHALDHARLGDYGDNVVSLFDPAQPTTTPRS